MQKYSARNETYVKIIYHFKSKQYVHSTFITDRDRMYGSLSLVNKKANDAGDSKMALVDEVTGALNLTRSTYSSESECSVKV